MPGTQRKLCNMLIATNKSEFVNVSEEELTFGCGTFDDICFLAQRLWPLQWKNHRHS